MAGFAKGILISILVTAATVMLMNLAFFFPWYITVIETAFEVSQIVANENYLPYDDYQNIYDQLKERPIFNKKQDKISIRVETVNGGKDCIEYGMDNGAEHYYDLDNKPYVQRGEAIRVTVSAEYPFEMSMWGTPHEFTSIPVEMNLRTTSLKYYKDLPYYVR